MTECQSDRPSDTQKIEGKIKLMNENESLDRLEKEVCMLRTEIDKIKWEQAVAEVAIGRTIIRGSASLADCYGFLLPQDIPRNNKNLMIENLKQDDKLNEKCLISNQKKITSSTLNKLSNPCPVKNKNNNKEDEFFTFG